MKELAAETLMLGNVDLELEKKLQLICVTKKKFFPMYIICI